MRFVHRLLNMCKVMEEKTGFQVLNFVWLLAGGIGFAFVIMISFFIMNLRGWQNDSVAIDIASFVGLFVWSVAIIYSLRQD